MSWRDQRNFRMAERAYKSKIKTFAHNSAYAVPGYDEQDMVQELLVVLWKCVCAYDPARGTVFNTLFTTSAKNRISSLIRAAETQKRGGGIEFLSYNEEAVLAMVDDVMTEMDSESMVILRITLQEAVDTYGLESLNGRRGRRRVA